MLLNRSSLNSTPLNTIGGTVTVVPVLSAAATAYAGGPTVVYGTIDLSPIQAIATSSAPDPVVRSAFFPIVSFSEGVGEGENTVIPHVGIRKTGLTPIEGASELLNGVKRIGIHAVVLTGEGQGELLLGNLVFAVHIDVTGSEGVGEAPTGIPRAGVHLSGVDVQVAEGEGQELQSFSVALGVMLRLRIGATSSTLIIDNYSTITIHPDPLFSTFTTTPPEVVYSSANLFATAPAFSYVRPLYNAAALSTIDLPVMTLTSEATTRVQVVMAHIDYPTITLTPSRLTSQSLTRVQVVYDDLLLTLLSPVALSRATSPTVLYSTTTVGPKSVAASSTKVNVVFTSATIPTLTASTTAGATSPSVRYSSVVVPTLTASASASLSSPDVILSGITIGTQTAGVETKARITTPVLSGVTVPVLTAGASTTSLVEFKFGTLTLPILTAATSSSTDVEYDVETHVPIVITGSIEATSSTHLELGLNTVVVNLMSVLEYSRFTTRIGPVLNSTVSPSGLTATGESKALLNLQPIKDVMWGALKVPCVYRIVLGPSAAGRGNIAADVPLPAVGSSSIVKYLTSDLMELQQAGYVHIQQLIDLNNRIGTLMTNLTGALYDTTIDPITDLPALAKAISSLTEQQNLIMLDIAELVGLVENTDQQLAYVLAKLDDAIPGSDLGSTLSKTCWGYLQVEDMR